MFVFLGISLLALLAILPVAVLSRRNGDGTAYNSSSSESRSGHESQTVTDDEILCRQPDREAQAEMSRRLIRDSAEASHAMVYISLMTNFSLPPAAIGLFASTTGLLEYTEFLVSQSWGRRLSFFIPQTSTAITDLDQAVALASGIMTLGFSMWDVLKVRQAAIRGERDREEELDRRIGIEMDRLGTDEGDCSHATISVARGCPEPTRSKHGG